ncbi:uncharacterized protein LOC130765725 [Actinidia eriantha]|uniref:uncharacterized protein LOC130765725 n=1 Tax=Actinidia eriantha TaxID=165200 RepID=UPI00258EDDAC|nr:uncharacterized protein LOC130765725 [Actinidia eriantha]
MKKTIKRDLMLDVSQNQVYRAKRKAFEIIQGNHREQYLRLWDYCEMVRRQNPGSTALLKLERPWLAASPIFQRLFICYDAQVKGFIEGCRPIIGLDACFLKGPYGGQLMHAVGRDANNQMYPLAIAIVEAESKSSWTWFMENLISVIGRPEERGWCFISDRKKGLTQTFEEVVPGVEHRYCIRHMHANFSKLFKRKEYKNLMWGAAAAYTVQKFEQRLEEIKTVNKDAYNWLLRESPSNWARCMFSPRAKCNRMDNNTSESFNSSIKEARDMPILTMLEMIRKQLMKRYQDRMLFSQTFTSNICPRIFKKLEKNKKKAMACDVIWAGEAVFEVTVSSIRTYIVDIGQRVCSCRKWDVTGIPCVHGVAAIITNKSRPEDFVQTNYDQIMPPHIRKRAGRPKKNRKKAEDEPKNPIRVRKHYTSLRCGKCKEVGHNSRTCNGLSASGEERQKIPPKGGKGKQPGSNSKVHHP